MTPTKIATQQPNHLQEKLPTYFKQLVYIKIKPITRFRRKLQLS